MVALNIFLGMVDIICFIAFLKFATEGNFFLGALFCVLVVLITLVLLKINNLIKK